VEIIKITRGGQANFLSNPQSRNSQILGFIPLSQILYIMLHNSVSKQSIKWSFKNILFCFVQISSIIEKFHIRGRSANITKLLLSPQISGLAILKNLLADRSLFENYAPFMSSSILVSNTGVYLCRSKIFEGCL
jgi:hypothetical protein